MEKNRLIAFIEKHYLWLMAVVAAAVAVGNRGAISQSFMNHYMEDIRDVILAGFDPSAAKLGCPAYPVWGYGLIFLITSNMLVLLVMQLALGLLATWLCVRFLERHYPPLQGRTWLLKLLLVVALPWWAFHAIVWPGSVGASLAVMGTVLLLEGLLAEGTSIPTVLGAGALFGLAANFRSELTTLSVVLGLVVLVCSRFSRKGFVQAALWVAMTFVMLVPWVLYTGRVTGEYRLSPTSSGGVLYIGLGENPHNKWGIVLSDDDPKTHELVWAKTIKHVPLTSCEGDKVLREEFWKNVREAPDQYLMRCLYGAKNTLIGGVYPGEFYRLLGSRQEAEDEHLAIRHDLVANPLSCFSKHGPGVLLVLVQLASAFMGRAVVLLSFVAMPFTVLAALRRRDVVGLVILAGILYMGAVTVLLAHFEDRLSSPVYLFHLVNLCLATTLLWRPRQAKAAEAEGAPKR